MAKLLQLGHQIGYSLWACSWRRDLLRPTFSIGSFSELVVPDGVRYVVLDKDNCFAKPHTTEVWPAFEKTWQQLLAANNQKYEVLVLSNTAGDAANDPTGELALALEKSVGVRVLRHRQKKPMCFEEVRALSPHRPNEILVVGDRLLTDVLLANLAGAQSAWIRPGVHPSALNKLEMYFQSGST